MAFGCRRLCHCHQYAPAAEVGVEDAPRDRRIRAASGPLLAGCPPTTRASSLCRDGCAGRGKIRGEHVPRQRPRDAVEPVERRPPPLPATDRGLRGGVHTGLGIGRGGHRGDPDTLEADPAAYAGFVRALVTWHCRTEHSVVRALSEGFTVTVLALARGATRPPGSGGRLHSGQAGAPSAIRRTLERGREPVPVPEALWDRGGCRRVTGALRCPVWGCPFPAQEDGKAAAACARAARTAVRLSRSPARTPASPPPGPAAWP
ncbi:DUF6086 family protein [Streptomyces sp. NPDC020731]|uniref:DUF6086 family protein n=1 Tax=Streptomyces sp. NPDC020731 TaxID=3365085 RepID=UPI0037B83AC9